MKTLDSIIPPEKILLFLGVFLVVSILVIVAIMVDLWDGVYTARKTGQRVHSHKLRVTIGKTCEYWRFILIGFLVDCIGVFFPFYFMPFTAVVFGAGLIVVEAKSMFEHASRRKSHTSELPDIFSRLAESVHEKNIDKIVKLTELLTTNPNTKPQYNESAN